MKLIQKQISIAIYITALFFGAVTLNSCTDFEDVNTNTIDCWSDLSGISLESTSELINTVYAFPASDKNEQMKAIAFQLWIALYNQGFEAWTHLSGYAQGLAVYNKTLHSKLFPLQSRQCHLCIHRVKLSSVLEV